MQTVVGGGVLPPSDCHPLSVDRARRAGSPKTDRRVYGAKGIVHTIVQALGSRSASPGNSAGINQGCWKVKTGFVNKKVGNQVSEQNYPWYLHNLIIIETKHLGEDVNTVRRMNLDLDSP